MLTASGQVRACEVCGNERLVRALDLGSHPMCDDLVPVGDTRRCREYPIDILFCEACVTAHQRHPVPRRELFPRSYHYRSRFTADVLDGMAALVASYEQALGPLSGKTVLDIGCNDGSLLDVFRSRGATTIGIEPTDAYRDAEQKRHIVFNTFLSPAVADAIVASHGQPDVITFTNVFAHIENLHDVINSLKRLMAPRSVVVIENHYLGAVLEKCQFDTFYHEHPRTYSYTSFLHVARSLDAFLVKVEFPSRYGGNIRVFLSASNPSPGENEDDLRELEARERRFGGELVALGDRIGPWCAMKRQALGEEIRRFGRLRAKAFPGRAAILIRLLGLDEESVSAVYEKPGSLKIGHYVPGTRIPILSDEELFAQTDRSGPLVNLAWHIPGEIRTYLTDHGYSGRVIDILSPEEFRSAG
jgi:SAM-dependent methyltransferase